MRSCPSCGYEESPYWRPAFLDVEKDVIKAEDLKNIDAGLFDKLVLGKDVIIGRNAYRLTKTGKWVQRMFVPIYEARGRSFRWVPQIDGMKVSTRLRDVLRGAGMIPKTSSGDIELDDFLGED